MEKFKLLKNRLFTIVREVNGTLSPDVDNVGVGEKGVLNQPKKLRII